RFIENKFIERDCNTFREILEKIYAEMRKSYRNEYFFKNEIVNKILLGRHNMNTATLLNEFRVNKSKVDLAILNGITTAYEIKSEFDNFNRLSSQLEDYSKFFEKVFVVTAEANLGKIESKLPENVGLIILTKKGTLATKKEASSNLRTLDHLVVLDALRQKEYIGILESYFSKKLTIPNMELYGYAKKMIVNIPQEDLNQLLIKELKNRKIPAWKNEFISSLPHCMKLLGIKNKVSKKHTTKIINQLKSAY
ncbi:MAG: sce7726 family protein, partial [Pseudomonadota bacterium]